MNKLGTTDQHILENHILMRHINHLRKNSNVLPKEEKIDADKKSSLGLIG
jgi:hypothetical protein